MSCDIVKKLGHCLGNQNSIFDYNVVAQIKIKFCLQHIASSSL